MSYKHTMSVPVYLTVMSMLWRSDKTELPENATLSTTINDIPRAMLAYDLNEITKTIASASVSYGGSPKPEKLFNEVLIDYSEVQPQCIMSVAAGGVPLLNTLLARVRSAGIDPGRQEFPNIETAEFYFWALEAFSGGRTAWNGTASECLQAVTGNLLTAAEEKNALPRVVDDVRKLGQEGVGPLELRLTLTAGNDRGVRLTAVRVASKPQENKEPPEVGQNREKLVEDARKEYQNIQERIRHCGYINCKNIPMHRAIRLAALAREENGRRHVSLEDLAAVSNGMVDTSAARMQLLTLLSSKTVSWASRPASSEPRQEVKLFKSVIWENNGITVEISDVLRPFFDEMAAGVTMELLRETREMLTPTASDLAVYLRSIYGKTETGSVTVKLSSVKDRMFTIDPSADMCYQTTILLPSVVQRINDEGSGFPFRVGMQCLNMTFNDASIRFTLTSKADQLRSPLSRPASEPVRPAAAGSSPAPAAKTDGPALPPDVSKPMPAAVPVDSGPVVSVQEVKSEPALLSGICCGKAGEMPQAAPASALSLKRNPFAEHIGPNDAVSLSGYKVPLRVLLSQVRPESLIDVLFDKSADLTSAQTFWDAVSVRENQVRNEGTAR